jgi:hypothetical protein
MATTTTCFWRSSILTPYVAAATSLAAPPVLADGPLLRSLRRSPSRPLGAATTLGMYGAYRGSASFAPVSSSRSQSKLTFLSDVFRTCATETKSVRAPQ